MKKKRNEFVAKNKVKELFSNVLLPVAYTPTFILALQNKNWMFSYIYDQNYEFCVSDFPIYLRPENNSLHSFVEDPNVEITIPLLKKLLLTVGGGFESKRQYTILTSHDELRKLIKQANQMLITNANWYIAGSKKTFIDELINSKGTNHYVANYFSSIDKILQTVKQ